MSEVKEKIQKDFNATTVMILKEILSDVNVILTKEKRSRYELFLQALTEINKQL